jgi:hypothetical protein
MTVMCPHCQTESRFRLRRMIAALHVLGHTLIELDSTYQIACSSCNFRKELNEAELSSAEEAKCLYQQLEAHEIDAARYSEALDALDFPTLRTLCVEAATWSCPECNEKVPATINACWNCGSSRPGLQKPSSPD